MVAGLHRAQVTRVDPEDAKVRLQVPSVLGSAESPWADPLYLDGETPSVGQQVWVGFEAGDPSKPVWMRQGSYVETHDHDDLYYTETEADALFLTEAEADALFLTQAEADALYLSLGGGSVNGSITVTGETRLADDYASPTWIGRNIEMGRTDGTAIIPYIDFHGGADVDRDARIILENANVNATVNETADLGYRAAAHRFSGLFYARDDVEINPVDAGYVDGLRRLALHGGGASTLGADLHLDVGVNDYRGGGMSITNRDALSPTGGNEAYGWFIGVPYATDFTKFQIGYSTTEDPERQTAAKFTLYSDGRIDLLGTAVIDFASSTGEKLSLYSDQYGIGIESYTLALKTFRMIRFAKAYTGGAGAVGTGIEFDLDTNDLHLNGAGRFHAVDNRGIRHDFGRDHGTADGLWVRPATNGVTIFGVQSSGYADRFYVDHNHPGTFLTAAGLIAASAKGEFGTLQVNTTGTLVAESFTYGTRLGAHSMLANIEFERNGTADTLRLNANDWIAAQPVYDRRSSITTNGLYVQVDTGGTGRLYAVTSSLRYKEGWRHRHDLADIELPEPIEWPDGDGGWTVGFAAEHMAEALPVLARYDADDEPVDIHDRAILAVLAAKVKRLEAAVA